ncbi:MAG: homoserine dehydrogenase [Candidatus Brocadiales bacterium]|nr:homoserine dehydrogenase [Candidatus Bathyanammoxibius sp.]MCQ4574784.1 homoserine dehydrogenase [Candidatus Bathyanammoxibius amoris]
MAEKVIKIGLLGSGTVGEGVQDIIFDDDGAKNLEKKLGFRLEIEKVYTRSPKKKRWYKKFPEKFTNRPEEVINHPEISIITEALGLDKADDVKKVSSYIVKALEGGKSVVTANKAVLAGYGREIYSAASKGADTQLRYEAAVAGGIPIIRSLGEGLACDDVTGVYGILNGTCNYILSGIRNEGMTFKEALRQAQKLGYAETNPEADINGDDTRDKVIVLLQLLYGIFVKKEDVSTEGIEHLEKIDFDYAAQKLSKNIKLLGSITKTGGEVTAAVSPIMINDDHVLSRVNGALNAVLVESRNCDSMCLVGKGAGAGPTANSVVSDIISIASGARLHPVPATRSYNKHLGEDQPGRYYLRFLVRDGAGIVSDILSHLKENRVNVDEVLQLRHSIEERSYFREKLGLKYKPDEILPFIITLEPCKEAAVREAIQGVKGHDFILLDPVVIKILPDLPDVVGTST